MATTRRRKPANRPNGRGTLFIERTYPAPIGLLRMASGTNDAQAYRDILQMLDALARGVPPRFDILQAIKGKQLTPLYALSLYRQGALEHVPTAAMLPPLQPKWLEWAEHKHCSEEYRRQLRITLGILLRHGTEPTIGDLPQMLQSFRQDAVARKTHVQFNRSKTHVQSFVRDTLRRRSPLYAEVSDVDALPEPEVERRPQRPEQLQKILQLLPQPHRRMAWELAATGLRPKEYWGRWVVVDAALQVLRSKTAAGRRAIPLWAGHIAGPQRARMAFEKQWKKHVGDRLDIYDLRRSFMVWMEDAGIPRSRRRIYFGHAARDVSDLYERRELDQWMVEDAARMQHYTMIPVEELNAWTPAQDAGYRARKANRTAKANAGRRGERRAVSVARGEQSQAPQTIPQTQEEGIAVSA